MNDEYREFNKDLQEIKTKIAVTDYFLSGVKEQDVITTTRLEELKNKVSELENTYFVKFRDTEQKLEYNINSFKDEISRIKTSLEVIEKSISSNTLLQLTNNMDAKKWLTLIGILLSILTSAGIVDKAIFNNGDQTTINENIQKLLELNEK